MRFGFFFLPRTLAVNSVSNYLFLIVLAAQWFGHTSGVECSEHHAPDCCHNYRVFAAEALLLMSGLAVWELLGQWDSDPWSTPETYRLGESALGYCRRKKKKKKSPLLKNPELSKARFPFPVWCRPEYIALHASPTARISTFLISWPSRFIQLLCFPVLSQQKWCIKWKTALSFTSDFIHCTTRWYDLHEWRGVKYLE